MPSAYAADAKNVIFFLGDGMGPSIVTAARIYKYGEDGSLTMDTLERTARIKTYLERCANHRQRAVDGGLHDRRQDEQ